METRKPPQRLEFLSRLTSSRETVWRWITSVEGISAELWPYLKMTTPSNIRSITDLKIIPGQRLFRSYVFLLGILPIDYSDLTLVGFEDGSSFLEQSPMASMKSWRHERRILDCPEAPGTVLLMDRLTFEPRMASGLIAWFIGRIFRHRHKVLRARLKGI